MDNEHKNFYCTVYTKEGKSNLSFAEWKYFPVDELHRDDGPAVIYSNGTNSWWVNGKLHRADGPAIEHGDGQTEWFIDGKRHRENSPAAEYVFGRKEWWYNGQMHRTDGPALVDEDGRIQIWVLNGNALNEFEVEKWLKENDIDLSTEEGQMAFLLAWG